MLVRKCIALSQATVILIFFFLFSSANNLGASRVPGKQLQVLHGELLLVLSLQILFCSYEQLFVLASNRNHT